MPETLRVTPGALRQAAASEHESGAAVDDLQAGKTLDAGASGMSELSTGAACDAVGAAFDTEGSAVAEALNQHADKLDTAANRYDQVDSEFARRLSKFTK